MQNSQIDNLRRINVYPLKRTTNLNCIHNSLNCVSNSHNSLFKTHRYHANHLKSPSKQPVTLPTTNINCQTIHAIEPKLSDNSLEKFQIVRQFTRECPNCVKLTNNSDNSKTHPQALQARKSAPRRI